MTEILFPEPTDPLVGLPRGGSIRTALDIDGRHIALETLRTFISLLDFSRTGAKDGPAIQYRIPRTNIFTEQPDDPVDLPMPAIAVLANAGTYDTYGLGPPQLIESSADVYGEGLVLVDVADYQEEIAVEVWAASRAERRSVVVGLTEAFTVCEDSWSLRLKLPDYFDQVATFSAEGHRIIDDTDAVKNRRRAIFTVFMTVPMVRLVRYKRFEARIVVDVSTEVSGG